MHPFGGTPVCPRCSKAVYAAEQVMGPGRKLYHKPCLACTICNKRLDSLTLLEHDQQPYCKSCHVKNFGTRDLRQANHPYAPYRDDSTPSSPVRMTSPSPIKTNGFAPPPRISSPVRSYTTGNGMSAPILRPNRSLASTPTTPAFPRPNTTTDAANPAPAESSSSLSSPTSDEHEAAEEQDTVDPIAERIFSFPGARTYTPTNTGRPGLGGIPRTVPLSPTRSGVYGEEDSLRPRHRVSHSLGSIPSTPPPPPAPPLAPGFTGGSNDSSNGSTTINAVDLAVKPLMRTATGTRYGVALGGGIGVNSTGGSPRKWGGSTPSCPRCGKSVYFAEQVKAVGKTFHKGCLRCTECNTLLDSSRLRDHDGDPLCVRCYGKLHGPQGSGYALLGKAGG